MRRCVPLVLALAGLLAPLAFALPPTDKGGSGLVVKGTSGPPDLQRGKLAAEAGHSAEAERDLVPLAERGYFEAQLALGRMYAHMQTPEAAQKAIRWFRAALPQNRLAVEVPLARLLLHQDDDKQLHEAERLFDRAWQERKDAEALSGLIQLYTDHPEMDPKQRVAALVAQAEKLDSPVSNAAVIRWYRATQDLEGHAERLVALCRKSLDLAPECYVDLVRDARAHGDKDGMQRLVAGASSQFGQNRVGANVLAGMARALVATPDNTEPEMAPVVISDVPGEVDPEDQAPGDANVVPGGRGLSAPASRDKTCAQDPVGVSFTPPAPPTAPGQPVTPPTPPPPKPPPEAVAANAEPDLANQLVKKLAAGPLDAQVAAAGLAVRFPFLAQDLDVEPVLKSGLKQHQPEATLYLGELYLYGQRATRNPKLALQHLQQATETPDTAVEGHYFLGRLYQYGYLDEVDPPRAKQHLLIAARGGHTSADGALARLYASAKGMCANHLYAYLFARLGARDGGENIRTLRDQLLGTLSAQEKQQAERLMQQELAARPREQEKTGLAQAGDSGGPS